MTIAARAIKLRKTYGSGSTQVVALDDVDFEVTSGEFTAIMGPSGSGKSTLMHLLAALDSPTSGSVFIGDVDTAALRDTPLTKLRRERIGFVFQAFNLVPTLTARENIVLPVTIAGKRVDQQWLNRIVAALGLGSRLNHKPSQLSGGQQQRVACARALMNRPDIVFADEPTGNLDSTSAAEVLDFLRRSVDEFGQTVVMVTHDALAASYADRAVFISDGRIVEEVRGATQEDLLNAVSRIYPRQRAAAPSQVAAPAPHNPTPTPSPSEDPESPAADRVFFARPSDEPPGSQSSSPVLPVRDDLTLDQVTPTRADRGGSIIGQITPSRPERTVFRDGGFRSSQLSPDDAVPEVESTAARRALLE